MWELQAAFISIRESALESMNYRIPKAVEDYLVGIIQTCNDWLAWIDQVAEYEKERGGGE